MRGRKQGKRSLHRILNLISAVILGGIVGFSIFLIQTRQSSTVGQDCKVNIVDNSTHFTVYIQGKDVRNYIFSIHVNLYSDIINFSVPGSSIPEVDVTERKAVFTLPVPINAEFNIKIVDDFGFTLAKRKIVNTLFTDDPKYTSFYCIGESWESRWCYTRNICASKGTFHVISPYSKVDFANPFFIPGSRAPPFDPHEFRVNQSYFNVVNEPIDDWSNRTMYAVSRFYNSRMLWHTVMDSLYPTWWTMTSHTARVMDEKWEHESNPDYGRRINMNNDMIVMDTFGWTDLYFIKAVSNNPPILFWEWKDQRCYRNAVLGIRKSDKPLKKKKKEVLFRDGLMVKYEVDHNGIRGLRKHMLEWAETSEEQCTPTRKRPLVLVVGRKPRTENDLKRKLINHDDVIQATKEVCPKCDVQMADFQKFNKKGQVGYTCNASAIIGVHGSGLIHSAWMPQTSDEHPTAIFEFLPYKYTCRDWYKQQTEINRQEYYPIYTLHRNQTVWDKHIDKTRMERCLTLEGECERNRCHNTLRDQSIIVDIPYYKAVLKPFFDRLQASVI